jgi:ATP-dependent Clp protease ATP-binding subunit ClpA
LGFQRVLQRAVFHVQSSGKKEVTGANVLVAIFSEQESQAVYLLKKQNVARIDVVNFVSHGISRVQGAEDQEGREAAQEESGEEAVFQYWRTFLGRFKRHGGLSSVASQFLGP